MKTTLYTFVLAAGSTLASATPFTYQGQLMDNGVPANGTYDMVFRLTDSPTFGFVLDTETINNVQVQNGVFTVEIDFDDTLMNNPNRWMSISVDGSSLSPRTRLRPAPRATNAIRANSAGSLDVPFDVHDFATTVFSARSASTTSNAAGLNGEISSTSPGAFSAGVRGENHGTGSLGVGVYGSHDGSGFGIYGFAPSGTGLYGRSDSRRGVYGTSTSGTGIYATTSTGIGLFARNTSSDTEVTLANNEYAIEATFPDNGSVGGTTAIFANASSTGILGQSTTVNGSVARTGVLGTAGGQDVDALRIYGVRGSAQASGTNPQPQQVFGVHGQAISNQSGNLIYGVYGIANGPNNPQSAHYAGYFNGDVYVQGNLGKATGTFKIDHPMDPENKYLSHSFVESPDMMNIYNGVINLDKDGHAVVTLPDYFETLNREFRYQLTAIGASMPNLYISSEVSANEFTISGGISGAKVSWEITGIRQDPAALYHPIIVEEEKPDMLKGKYLNPKAYGLGRESAIHPGPDEH